MARALFAPCILSVSILGALFATGCARSPSSLAPHFTGSIGMPHRGVLTKAAELPREGEGYRLLVRNERHYATPRFVGVVERAAAKVARERPGAMLTVGDLSARHGGKISSHASHRTGRDGDLLLYMTTLEGAPITTTSFVHVGNDGLAFDEDRQRFLRFDVEREWILVKALVEDAEARVQWLFVSRPVRAMLIDWARARGEPGETILRAMDVMLEPGPPAQSHDDHIHVRIACDLDELAAGCEHTGPTRPWVMTPEPSLDDGPTTLDLVLSLVQPLSRDATAAR
ncbi:MAG: penicillin-insensitive murein endopeptidase [Labilithrix sp.]|nr:penicillin-insensitive murein endopeptidase [Labilithrix sp.]